MTAFLSGFYSLICVGYVLGFLINNDECPNIVKVLMAIFSPFIAPLLFGAALGMIIVAKVKKETNRE